jgi:hypothetical protein
MRPTTIMITSALWLGSLSAGCSGDDPGGKLGDRDGSILDRDRDGAVPDGGGGTGGGGATGGAGGTGGGGPGGFDAGPDANLAVDAAVVLPPPAECGRVGDACTAGTMCCSGVCDAATDSCASSLQQCSGAGDACADALECCGLSCGGDGKCSTTQCVSDGLACTTDAQCCGQSCVNDVCAPLTTACKTSGNACNGSGQCCSGLCADDVCQIAASYCIQENDICSRSEDCCTGTCLLDPGETIGVCGPPPTGASFCNDGIEGSLCGDCNQCCSRLCAPYGPTGVNICQPASGCHVTGDFCRQDGDCCGVEGTGLPGDGNVTCEKEAGSDLGVCRNPLSCNPQGNVCHYKDYACDGSSARANCCGGLGAKSGECQLDGLGVPRCNGLGTECRAAGATCASADDCCNDVPCTPDAQGVLRCFDPPDGEPACVPSAGACTVNADCCVGGTCVRPVGSTAGTCGVTTPPPLPDGGTPDSGSGPACAEYGQTCETGADCCNSVPCDQGVCRVPFG